MRGGVLGFDEGRGVDLLGTVLLGQFAALVSLADPVGVGVLLFECGGGFGLLAHGNIPEYYYFE